MKRKEDIAAIRQNWDSMIRSKNFSMTRIYHCLIQDSTPGISWHHLMCHNIARPRAKITLWLCYHGRLATKERLYKLGLLKDTKCELCGHDVESIDHTIFTCKYATVIWEAICHWMQINAKLFNLNWINSWTHGKGWRKGMFKALAAETIHAIWTQRNYYIFHRDTYTIDSDRVVKNIIDAVVYRGWKYTIYRSKIVILLM
ncbi:uncharacterized protein LOC131604414 [Vicia villosa]|uniref:uncharacterized protein LOC131604414 n=1 Tax=Vicia villosa TaxID=3911 RepID=UPI00273B575B|nr:uncharacterized protein LOC131604414 [Vicia villosa]